MKKMIALLLALMMVLSLAACGGDTSTESESSSNDSEGSSTTETANDTSNMWTLQQTVDEFGDVTENSETIVSTSFSGDFSNTATSSSELSGVVFMNIGGSGYQYNYTEIAGQTYHQTIEGNHPIFTFRLLEYGNTQATYISSDAITLKAKIDDTVYDYDFIISSPPNGDLIVLDTEETLYNALYEGKDIRIIINIGSSKYNFTLYAVNFSSIVKEANLLTETLYYSETSHEEICNEAKELIEAGSYIEAADILTHIMDYSESVPLLCEAIAKETYYNGNDVALDYWDYLEGKIIPLSNEEIKENVIHHEWYDRQHRLECAFTEDGICTWLVGGSSYADYNYEIEDTILIIHGNSDYKFTLYHLYGTSYAFYNMSGTAIGVSFIDDKLE